ncbi:UDP-glucose dehydrogenase family protein [Microbacterium sp.]|uniref:UDP-glucose dehydrogenase family protein n=1 Tax=Microbacterium sp. TaxID=51671 RepID=UPI003A87DB14
MKISVIGCGYLGAVHAASMAALGHEVVGVDVDEHKVNMLAAGHPPFFEPGFAELLSEQLDSGRLRFTIDMSEVGDCPAHFLAVGTPQIKGGQAADLTYLHAAVEALTPHLQPASVVIGKSTVPVGTAAEVAETVAFTGAIVAWNPEFLREGFAVQDTLSPDRLVYGLPSGSVGVIAKHVLDTVYADLLERDTPVIATDHQTAELVKVSANAFLATKISFINSMAEIAEAVDADITELADAIGYDARIGRRFLNAGVGFGGGCLPKDLRAFAARAEELGRGDSVAFLKEVDTINLRRRERVVKLVLDALGGEPHGRRVAVLGLAFKPESDDVRDSPALDVAVRLKGLGIEVVATDPEAIENAARLHSQLSYEQDLLTAVTGADATVLVTEWAQYQHIDPEILGNRVNRRVLIDARNCVDRARWMMSGWEVMSMGRRRIAESRARLLARGLPVGP